MRRAGRMLLTLARILTLAALVSFLFVYGGASALADDSTPEEAGPVPADALSRLGRGTFDIATISPDERRVAVSTPIGMYMYDATTMQQMWYSEGYDLLTVSVDFSPDSKRLLGGHGNDQLVSWDVESGAILAHYNYEYGTHDARFSGDGRYVVGTAGSEVVTWDSTSGAMLYWKNDTYNLGLGKIATSPDGTMFASSGIISDMFDEIAVWDTPTGAVKHTFKVVLPGQYPWTRVLRFTPDNKYLVAGFDDGWIKAWDLEKGTLAFTI